MGLFDLFKRKKDFEGIFSFNGKKHKITAKVDGNDSSIKAKGTIESNGKTESFEASFSEVSKVEEKPRREVPVRHGTYGNDVYDNEKKLKSYFH